MTVCHICDKPLSFRWTDTHGVGACMTCGAPHRLYHYEDGNRVEKPAEPLLAEPFAPLLRRYFTETGRNVDPGAFNFPGSSYEVATREDFETLKAWEQKHIEEFLIADAIAKLAPVAH